MTTYDEPQTASVRALSTGTNTTVLVLSGAITPGDIPRLCRRVRALLQGGTDQDVLCDVGSCAAPDAVTVDALARFQLTARRLGRRVRLLNTSRELKGLLLLMGFCDVLPLAFEAQGETEEGEEAGGVEEEADP